MILRKVDRESVPQPPIPINSFERNGLINEAILNSCNDLDNQKIKFAKNAKSRFADKNWSREFIVKMCFVTSG